MYVWKRTRRHTTARSILANAITAIAALAASLPLKVVRRVRHACKTLSYQSLLFAWSYIIIIVMLLVWTSVLRIKCETAVNTCVLIITAFNHCSLLLATCSLPCRHNAWLHNRFFSDCSPTRTLAFCLRLRLVVRKSLPGIRALIGYLCNKQSVFKNKLSLWVLVTSLIRDNSIATFINNFANNVYMRNYF